MNLSERRFLNPEGMAIFSAALLAAASFGGCEKKEKVLDVQAPGFNLEINKTTSGTGDKNIEIKSGSEDQIEIDATHKKAVPEN